MDARCIKCSNAFMIKFTRGSKLNEYTCSCGGKFEPLQYSAVYSTSPLFDILKQHREPQQTRFKGILYFSIFYAANTGVFILDSHSQKYIKIN